MSIKEIRVPDIGHFSEVEVIEVAITNGADLKSEDTLVTLETEKASMDVPSPFNGKVREVKLKVGDKVKQGDLIALVETDEITNTPEKALATPAPQTQGTPTEAISAPQQSQIIEVVVPDTGGANEIEVIEIPVKVGDEIALETTLVTLESEKASMDIPSPFAGKIENILIKLGDKVKQGTPIVAIKVSQAQAASETPKLSQAVTASLQPAPSQPKIIEQSHSVNSALVHAGPATRRLARELGVDLVQVKGSGKKDRVVTKDVQAYVKSILQGTGAQRGNSLGIEPAPDIDFSQFGEIEVKPLGKIKKWTAKNLHRNWVMIPHVTQFDEADITELEVFREENKQAAQDNGIRLTPLAFIMKAVISALKHFPQFNASLDKNGTDLILKKYFHLGVAVDTPNGLVVPVVRDVDTKSLFDLARELGEKSQLARDGKLKTAQMQGSCFSITSLGGVGGTAFTPIINAPDVAILGVSKAQIKPVYIGEQFVPRKMLPLSLSYDHRVIDGVEAAKFLNHIIEQLQDIRKLLL